MPELSIRLAVAQDVAALKALVAAAYGHYVERLGRKPAPMEADYGRLADEKHVWVLEVDRALAGMMILRPFPDHLLISNVAVAPAYQGRRLGSQLLAFAEAQAREHGLGEMRLFTNDAMHENLAIYTRLGWHEYDRAEQDGFRRVFMSKQL